MAANRAGRRAAPLDQPIVCPVLIGRERHLNAILRCVDAARAGQGRVLLVAGEAGIGKSRLLTEARAQIESDGTVVRQGHCFEPDRSLPYAPFSDILRSALRAQTPSAIADALGPTAGDLVSILPDLSDLLPVTHGSHAVDPEQEKRRLFLALSQFFVDPSNQGPIVVAIEDVHWSDDASLDFVEYLARRIADHPIVLLLTFRTDQVGPHLATLLTEFDRGRIASEVRLTRLERADVDAMIRATLGGERPVRPLVLDTIFRLTDGNPFFVEEVVRSLVADGVALFGEVRPDHPHVEHVRVPRSVDEAVRRRFDGLSQAARETVTIAAVAGRRFDLSLLRALLACDEGDLFANLKELLAADLVIEESADRFAFRHALTRQAIYSRLLAAERRTYHQAIAETIEQTRDGEFDAHLADLAYHTFAAGQWEKAIDYGQRAGEAAFGLHAARAAAEHFGRAIAAAEELAHAHQPGIYRRMPMADDVTPALYRRRGQAYEILGEFDLARSDLETALALTRTTGDRRAEWQALIDLGFLWAERDYGRTGDLYRQASEVAQTIADPLLHARSLNRLGNWLTNVGRAADALHAHREALTLVEELEDGPGEAETLDLLGMTCGLALGDAIASAAYYDRAIALVRASGDLPTLVSSLTARAAFTNPHATEPVSSPLTRREAIVAQLDEACTLARTCEWPAALAFAEYVLGETFAGFGVFGAALDHAGAGLRIATEIDHQQWVCGSHCMLGVTHVAMLAPELAFPHLESALALGRALGSAWWIGMSSAHLARAHLLAGSPSRAEAVLADAMPSGGIPRNAGERWTVCAWGELALAKGQPEDALRIAADLQASAPGEVTSQPIPALLRLQGEALLALRRFEVAEQALEAAKCGAIQRGAAPLLWQIHRALTRLRLARRELATARSEAAAARDVVAEFAASIHDEVEREEFVQAATSSLPTLPLPTPPSTRQRDAARFDGLTRREREVAEQIALGRSNREIAANLFTAERTVASHVGNILTKLGFSSRTQIAVWAREHDLGGHE